MYIGTLRMFLIFFLNKFEFSNLTRNDISIRECCHIFFCRFD